MTSYLGKYAQFASLDPDNKPSTPITTPQTITINKIPDAVIADIKQLNKDAGL